jgi:hypothetical protein
MGDIWEEFIHILFEILETFYERKVKVLDVKNFF